MIYWWIATSLVGVVIGFVAVTSMPWRAGNVAGYLLRAVSLVPTFALLARRLHDQDRAGWWALLLPLSIALSLPDAVRSITFDPQNIRAYEQAGPHPARWVAALADLATLILCLLPGTSGGNRFGSDPRESGAAEDSL